MTGVVTSIYRYKRPPRKRKPVRLEAPAIVRRGTKPETPPAPANDDRKPAIVTVSGHGPAAVADGSVEPRSQPTAAVTPRSAIVTARRPGARPSVEVPDMTREEHQRRGDAATELWRELVHRATGKD